MSYQQGMGLPLESPVHSPVLARAQSRLQDSERSYSRTQQELQTLMRVRATTPMSAVETNLKDQEIAYLQQKLRETENEMHKLRDTVQKQQVTIKTQSEAISNPKQRYTVPTPQRFGDNGPYGPNPHSSLPGPPGPPPFFNPSASGYGPPPQAGLQFSSPFDSQPPGREGTPFKEHHRQPSSLAPMSQNRGPPMQPLPAPFRPSGHVNEFGSPEPGRSSNYHDFPKTPMGTNQGTRGTPNSTGRSQNHSVQGNFSQPPRAPPFAGPTAVTRSSDPAALDGVKNMFMEILCMAETYAWAHVNMPSTQKDNALPQAIKDRLLKAASTTSAFQFMQTPYTRYLLVEKVIVQWMLRNIFKHDCFAGFDPEVDRVMESCRSQMYQTTPAQVKHQLISTMSEQMGKLKANQNFKNYVNTIGRSRGNELWAILKPMMHQKTSRDWDDLFTLMLRAHDLALVMYSGFEEYKFDYPVMGQPLRLEQMESRDPFPNIHPPGQLEAMGATVRLGITPLITVRTNTPAGHVNSTMLLKAQVLIKADK